MFGTRPPPLIQCAQQGGGVQGQGEGAKGGAAVGAAGARGARRGDSRGEGEGRGRGRGERTLYAEVSMGFLCMQATVPWLRSTPNSRAGQ